MKSPETVNSGPQSGNTDPAVQQKRMQRKLDRARGKKAMIAVNLDQNLRMGKMLCDTAEAPVRHEKLRKGIKIVVGGPVHSGKSVLSKALVQALGDLNAYAFNAAPDGEYRGLDFTNREAVKQREKGTHNPEFVKDRAHKIASWVGPVMIIDIGGIRSKENKKIIQGATHAIIVTGSGDGRARHGISNNNPGRQMDDVEPHHFIEEAEEWKKFFEEEGITTIAAIQSDFYGKKDRLLSKKDGVIRGSVHHLNRAESAREREITQLLAEEIRKIVKNNTLYEGPSNPFTEKKEKFLNGIPVMKYDNGRSCLNYSAIPQVYARAKEYGDRPVWIEGELNSWESAVMMSALLEAGCPDARPHGEDGYIQVKPLEQSEEVDPAWWKETAYNGVMDGKPVYTVKHRAAAHSGIPIDPSALDETTVPKMPEDAIVLINCGGLNWLKSSIAASYMGKVDSIGMYNPGHGSVIVWSKNKKMLGIKLSITDPEDEKWLNKTPPELANYLGDAKRNLMATSRTAHGVVDTSSSPTKAEALEKNSSVDASKLAQEGFEKAMRLAYHHRKDRFKNPEELQLFVENIARVVNGGIVRQGKLIRSGEDSTKYPYVQIADLPKAMKNFYNQLLSRLNNPMADPVETAAFVEYGIDMSGHFFADGCSKTAKAVAALILMRAKHALPDYSRGESRDYNANREEYYSHSPKEPQGSNVTSDKENYTKFVKYYRSLFSK